MQWLSHLVKTFKWFSSIPVDISIIFRIFRKTSILVTTSGGSTKRRLFASKNYVDLKYAKLNSNNSDWISLSTGGKEFVYDGEVTSLVHSCPIAGSVLDWYRHFGSISALRSGNSRCWSGAIHRGPRQGGGNVENNYYSLLLVISYGHLSLSLN